MAGPQSYIFRLIAKFARARLETRRSVAEMRAFAGMGSNYPVRPRGVRLESIQIDNVRAEWLIPAKAVMSNVILFLHGKDGPFWP